MDCRQHEEGLESGLWVLRKGTERANAAEAGLVKWFVERCEHGTLAAKA